MGRASDGTNVPIFLAPASSSNLVSPDGSLPDLEGIRFRACTMEEKSTKSTKSYSFSYKSRLGLKIASIRLLGQWPPRQLRLKTLNKIWWALWARVLLWKQFHTLAPVDLTQHELGTCLDRVKAPQPLGPSSPMAHGPPMTRGIQDGDLTLSQALNTNMHGVPSYYGICRQIHLIRHFSQRTSYLIIDVRTHCLAPDEPPNVSLAHSYHLHAIHDERLIVRSVSVSFCSSFSRSRVFTSSLPHSTYILTCTLLSMWTAPRETNASPSPNEECSHPGDIRSSQFPSDWDYPGYTAWIVALINFFFLNNDNWSAELSN